MTAHRPPRGVSTGVTAASRQGQAAGPAQRQSRAQGRPCTQRQTPRIPRRRAPACACCAALRASTTRDFCSAAVRWRRPLSRAGSGRPAPVRAGDRRAVHGRGRVKPGPRGTGPPARTRTPLPPLPRPWQGAGGAAASSTPPTAWRRPFFPPPSSRAGRGGGDPFHKPAATSAQTPFSGGRGRPACAPPAPRRPRRPLRPGNGHHSPPPLIDKYEPPWPRP